MTMAVDEERDANGMDMPRVILCYVREWNYSSFSYAEKYQVIGELAVGIEMTSG